MGDVEMQRIETRKVQHSMCGVFHLGNHDLHYISNATTFNKAVKPAGSKAPATAQAGQ